MGEPRSLSGVKLPLMISGFEDMAFLFDGNSRGVIRLDVDEARLLWEVARAGAGDTLEIGRLYGGSTVLLAAATGRRVVSIDCAPRDDEALKKALDYLIASEVTLIVGSSTKLPAEGFHFGGAFIDGDHSYDAVKADFNYWFGTLDPGAWIAFHDMLPPDAETEDGTSRFFRVLIHDERVKLVAHVGSLAVFMKM